MRTVIVVVLDAEQYDDGYPPIRLQEFRKWFAELVGRIPEAYRDSARIEFDSINGFECSCRVQVTVTYTRPETAEEKAAREAQHEAQMKFHEDQERRHYEALRRKFGDG